VKPLSDWTRDELETELARIDAMRLPLSTATMRQRNEIWLEIERRPRQRQPLRIEEPARKMNAQLDALKVVGR
jgi:hypothetical protein